MKFSDFKNQLDSELKKAGDRFISLPWESKNFYVNWLAQTYFYSSHTTRLLALGGSRFTTADDALHYRFLQHAGEEKKHEQLAIRDLQNLGTSLKEFPESANAQSLYQTQYYWIEHVSPFAFFGYITALEGIAVFGADAAYKKIMNSPNAKGSSFIKVHAGEDPDHLDKAYAMIEQTVKNPADLEMIKKNFDLTLALYFSIAEDCAKKDQVRETLTGSRAA